MHPAGAANVFDMHPAGAAKVFDMPPAGAANVFDMPPAGAANIFDKSRSRAHGTCVGNDLKTRAVDPSKLCP